MRSQVCTCVLECLERDNPREALAILRKMKLAQLVAVTGDELGLPVYNQTKKSVVATLERCLPSMTKSATQEFRQRDDEARRRLRVQFLQQSLRNHDAAMKRRRENESKLDYFRAKITTWRPSLYGLLFDELMQRGVHPEDAYEVLARHPGVDVWNGLNSEAAAAAVQAGRFAEHANLACLPPTMLREDVANELAKLESAAL